MPTARQAAGEVPPILSHQVPRLFEYQMRDCECEIQSKKAFTSPLKQTRSWLGDGLVT